MNYCYVAWMEGGPCMGGGLLIDICFPLVLEKVLRLLDRHYVIFYAPPG